MNLFARRIAAQMAANKQIKYEEQAYYAYGLEVLLSNIILFISIFCISFFVKEFLISFYFTALFAVLRFFLDGFHCKRYSHCYMASMGIYFVFIFLYKAMHIFKYQLLVTAVFLFASTTIYVTIKAIKHLNSHYESNVQFNSLLFASYLLVAVFLLSVGLYKMAFPIAYVMLTTISLLLAKKITEGGGNYANKEN